MLRIFREPLLRQQYPCIESAYRSKSSDDPELDMSPGGSSASLAARQPPQLLSTTIQRPRAGGTGPNNDNPKQPPYSQASEEEVSPSVIFELSKLPPAIRKMIYRQFIAISNHGLITPPQPRNPRAAMRHRPNLYPEVLKIYHWE
jgi:hypothetical protein